MNFALLSSNINEVKHLVELQEQRPLFCVSLALIITSMTFQVIAKLFTMLTYRFKLTTSEGASKLKCLNYFISVFTVFIMLTNLASTVVTILEEYGPFAVEALRFMMSCEKRVNDKSCKDYHQHFLSN